MALTAQGGQRTPGSARKGSPPLAASAKCWTRKRDPASSFRLYHRKDGKVVKELDDLMSATRYALMMIRFAETAPMPLRRIRYPHGSWMGA
jgi:hypothetical protein